MGKERRAVELPKKEGAGAWQAQHLPGSAAEKQGSAICAQMVRVSMERAMLIVADRLRAVSD